MNPIIELREVVKVYSTEAGEFPALRGVSLSVNAGEFLGIVGKSGAGKSTLLNMINGVDHLTSGDVLVRSNADEVAVHRLTESELALWRGRTMGVVYQSFQLLPMLTLIENIVLPMDLCGLYQPRESRARALANDPPILVADEPTGSLDSITADHIFDVFEHLVSEQGKTIIMVTHDDSLAPRFSRHVTLADGRLYRTLTTPHA